MGNLSKKLHRTQNRKKLKKAKKELASKLQIAEHMPDNCSVCSAKFDRKSKEHAMTWKVVVYNNKSLIRLFCPDCIEKTQKVINEN